MWSGKGFSKGVYFIFAPLLSVDPATGRFTARCRIIPHNSNAAPPTTLKKNDYEKNELRPYRDAATLMPFACF